MFKYEVGDTVNFVYRDFNYVGGTVIQIDLESYFSKPKYWIKHNDNFWIIEEQNIFKSIPMKDLLEPQKETNVDFSEPTKGWYDNLVGVKNPNKGWTKTAIKQGYDHLIDKFPYFHLGFEEKDNLVSGRVVLYKKHKIPTKVVFDESKGKTTMIFGGENNTKPTYVFTSKVSKEDKFNISIGFMLTYYKYLMRNKMSSKDLKQHIDNVFEYSKKPHIFFVAEIQRIIETDGISKQEFSKIVEHILSNYPQHKQGDIMPRYEWTYQMYLDDKKKIEDERKKDNKQAIKYHKKQLDRLYKELRKGK